MNNDRQDCPYLPDLIRNRDLQRKLEHEQKKRMEAEARSWPLVVLNILLAVLLYAAFVAFVACGGQTYGDITTYTYLVHGFALLFFTFSLALMAVNITLNDHAKRKNAAKKKED